MLLVHFNDLKNDRSGEMRRIADFLGIEIPEAQWPALVEAASFEAMKGHADQLIPQAQILWEGGGNSFLNKGTNGRWRDVAAKDDLDRYDAKINAEFSPALARWIENGRLIAGDPRQSG
jgi:aryl sulfotransferase